MSNSLVDHYINQISECKTEEELQAVLREIEERIENSSISPTQQYSLIHCVEKAVRHVHLRQ